MRHAITDRRQGAGEESRSEQQEVTRNNYSVIWGSCALAGGLTSLVSLPITIDYLSSNLSPLFASNTGIGLLFALGTLTLVDGMYFIRKGLQNTKHQVEELEGENARLRGEVSHLHERARAEEVGRGAAHQQPQPQRPTAPLPDPRGEDVTIDIAAIPAQPADQDQAAPPRRLPTNPPAPPPTTAHTGVNPIRLQQNHDENRVRN